MGEHVASEDEKGESSAGEFEGANMVTMQQAIADEDFIYQSFLDANLALCWLCIEKQFPKPWRSAQMTKLSEDGMPTAGNVLEKNIDREHHS